jgi:hypothetical protein
LTARSKTFQGSEANTLDWSPYRRVARVIGQNEKSTRRRRILKLIPDRSAIRFDIYKQCAFEVFSTSNIGHFVSMILRQQAPRPSQKTLRVDVDVELDGAVLLRRGV